MHVGDELPLWAGASAKVLLRDASPALLDRIARSSPYGAATLASACGSGSTRPRDAGYAVSHGEREDGPVGRRRADLRPLRRVVAALGLSGPTVRFTESRIAEFAADLKRVAQSPCPSAASTIRSGRHRLTIAWRPAVTPSHEAAAATARRGPRPRPDQRPRRAVLHLSAGAARRRGGEGGGARARRPGPAARPGPGPERAPASARRSWPRTPARSRSSSTSRPPTDRAGLRRAGRRVATCWSRTSGPGVLARLGFAGPRLRELNPGLIYCAISGFGQTGPMSQAPAYDQIIQGLSGMMSITGTPETAPLRVGFPVCDTVGGLTAALAITAAIAGRQRDGQGCYLDVSMLEASLSAMGWAVSNYLVGGVAPQPDGRPERHRRAVGHLRRRGRPAQHRRQPAGAVRDAVPAGRPAGPGRPTRGSPTASSASGTATSSTGSSTRRWRAARPPEWEEMLVRRRRAGGADPDRRPGGRARAARATASFFTEVPFPGERSDDAGGAGQRHRRARRREPLHARPRRCSASTTRRPLGLGRAQRRRPAATPATSVRCRRQRAGRRHVERRRGLVGDVGVPHRARRHRARAGRCRT